MNTTAESGTALDEFDGTTSVVAITGGIITGGNTSVDGGGVTNTGTLTLGTGVNIVGNKAKCGAGVYSGFDTVTYDSTVSINGANIVGNAAYVANKYGGGLYQNNRDTVEFNAGMIAYNTADRGGAVYMNSLSSFTMSGGIVRDNISKYQVNSQYSHLLHAAGSQFPFSFVISGGYVSDSTLCRSSNVVVTLTGGYYTEAGKTDLLDYVDTANGYYH